MAWKVKSTWMGASHTLFTWFGPPFSSKTKFQSNLERYPTHTHYQWNSRYTQVNCRLVGGWTNPSEKYLSDWIISPRFGVKIKNSWNHHLVEYMADLSGVNPILSNQFYRSILAWGRLPKFDNLSFFSFICDTFRIKFDQQRPPRLVVRVCLD